jgi:Family of unknown function (DUF5329)
MHRFATRSIPSAAAARCLAAALLATATVAQQGVRLVRVPEQLVLPTAAGQNLLLEVEVPVTATAVWLGANGIDERVPFAATGAGRYQLNLADPRVGKLARAHDRQLTVHALVDGEQLSSAWISFRRPAVAATGMSCAVWRTGHGAPEDAAADAWLAPRDVDRIEIGGASADVVLMAHMGATDRPLVRSPGRTVWTLRIDDVERTAWQQAGSLVVAAQRAEDTAVCFELRAIPVELAAPAAGLPFVVGQRRRAPIPGTRDWLSVELDDITAGQVRLQITSANGRVLVPARSVRDGDTVPLPLGGDDAVLVVEVLQNLLIGEDYAELRAQSRAAFAADRIEALLRLVAASKYPFVRNGRVYTGAAAAAHLRRKLAAASERPSVDAFIDQIASKSSTTGEDYSVQLADGTATPMAQWLRRQLEQVDAEAKRGKTSPR